MAQYLDKFKDVIGKRQTEQVLKLLNKKRNTGQIRTIQEFTSQLESLMRDLTSTDLIPSLSMHKAKDNEIIDSDRYNDMLDRVEDDLSAAFEETINIDEVQKSHEAIIRDVILKNLRSGVAELESKISVYEFINRDNRGFDTAIFSTFRESKAERTQRGNLNNKILFTDPRDFSIFSTSEDATIELVGERLTLAASSSSSHDIVGVRQIFDAESPQSEVIVQPPSSKLENMIDNTKGTYWLQTLLFKERKNFVKTKLEFDLGSVKEINFIEIDPASEYGITLEKVHYLDGNQTIVDLNIPERFIDGPAGIKIKKIATRKVILTFRNDNFSNTQFEKRKQDPLSLQALNEPALGFEAKKELVEEELNEILASKKVKEILDVKEAQKEKYTGYSFTTGIDNVRLGIADYENKSVYVSAPLTTDGLGNLGLRSAELRPYIDLNDRQLKFTEITYDVQNSSQLIDDSTLVPGQTSNTFFVGSIEYWVVKQDYSSSGTLLKTVTMPVLPLDMQRVYHERVVLSERSDVTLDQNDLGSLMFFTNRVNGNIKVYRNGILLADETGNALATDGWQEDPTPNTAGSTANNGERMHMRIKVLNLLPGDIITASYTPMVSSTSSVPKGDLEFNTSGGLQVVDLVGNLSARVGPGQEVILDSTKDSNKVSSSKIYLQIVLRQNTADSSVTPIVEEYILLGGKKDSTKFEEV